jgi:sulfite exporter TauE/SafE
MKETVMNKQRNSGYIMVGVGFAMLLANAFSYIFDWDVKSSAFTILGLVFVSIGLKTARKPSM